MSAIASPTTLPSTIDSRSIEESEIPPIKIDPLKRAKSLPVSRTVVIHPQPPKLPSPKPELKFEDLVERGIMPELFCRKIEALNRKKAVNDPIALVFLPDKDDQRNTFSVPSAQYMFLELAQTRTVILHRQATINIRQGIEKYRPLLEQPNDTDLEDLLIFFTHGAPDMICFGDSESTDYTGDHVSVNDYKGLRPKTTLMLMACQSGQNLARKISKVYDGAVMACQEDFLSVGSYIHECAKHRRTELVSLNDSNQMQHVRIYKGHKLRSRPCENPEIHKKKMNYLQVQARIGNPLAQSELAACYSTGLYHIRKSIFNYVKYILKASKSDPNSKFSLQEFMKLKNLST